MDLKRPNPHRLPKIARWLASADGRTYFGEFFGPGVALVPAPRHVPLRPGHRQRLSPTGELVAALEDAELGNLRDWLERDVGVAKSAWAPRGQRPTELDHRRTISVHPPSPLGLERSSRITVVDDVITTGATLHACVRLLEEAHPLASVLAFAMVRTRGDLDQVESVLDPVSRGTITLEPSGKTRRVP